MSESTAFGVGSTMSIRRLLSCSRLEMLAGVLVLVRRTNHAEHVLLRRQRHRAHHSRASAGDRLDDLARRAVDHLVVVRLEPDADLLSRHGVLSLFLVWHECNHLPTPEDGRVDLRRACEPSTRPPRIGCVCVQSLRRCALRAMGRGSHPRDGPHPVIIRRGEPRRTEPGMSARADNSNRLPEGADHDKTGPGAPCHIQGPGRSAALSLLSRSSTCWCYDRLRPATDVGRTRYTTSTGRIVMVTAANIVPQIRLVSLLRLHVRETLGEHELAVVVVQHDRQQELSSTVPGS